MRPTLADGLLLESCRRSAAGRPGGGGEQRRFADPDVYLPAEAWQRGRI